MGKSLTLFISLLMSFFAFSQAKIPNYISEKSVLYANLGYFFAVPFERSIENPFKSRGLSIGLTYTGKIVSDLNWGLGLAYENRKSFIKKDKLSVLDENKYFNKIYTYHNYLNTDVFLRFNFAKSLSFGDLLKESSLVSHYNRLGAFVDVGFFYKYAFGYGNHYINMSNKLLEKHKYKKPNYMSPHSYGTLVRFGYDRISLIAIYNFEEWLRSYGDGEENYNRGNLQIGIQINCY